MTRKKKPTKTKRRRKSRRKQGVYQSTKAGACVYRSGWELCLMRHMDADPAVQSFVYEPVEIPYVSNIRSGKTRRYLPDFMVTYVDGHRELVEVKPLRRLKNMNVQKKHAAAAAWCLKEGVVFCVITERELKTMVEWGP